MYNFHIGMKVVCVDAQDYDPWSLFTEGTLDGLTEGMRYTIRDMYIEEEDDSLCLNLTEIRREVFDDGEVGYRATRFRPLITTDISIFQAMLSPTPVKQRESEDA